MPPVKKFQKEDIIQTAYEIARKEGLEDINARRIAKELSCSTQPIYQNFTTMEELKAQVVEKIYQDFLSYICRDAEEDRPYLSMGLFYIRFAQEYPNFFKILFMNDNGPSLADAIQLEEKMKIVLEAGRIFSRLTEKQQKDFHFKVWIFTHGLATLAATGTVHFTDAEIKELLASTVQEMLVGYKQEQEET